MGYTARIVSVVIVIMSAIGWSIYGYIMNGYYEGGWKRFLISLTITSLYVLIGWWIGSQFDKSKFYFQKFRENEVELLNREHQYKSLFDNNQDAVAMLDLDGAIVNINSIAERIFGYKADDIVGKSVQIFVSKEGLKDLLEGLEKAKEGEAQQVSLHLIHKNGHLIKIFAKTVPIVVNHRITGLYMIAKDVTENERLENAISDISKVVSAQVGEVFFQSLVQYTAKLLNVDYAYIGEWIGNDKIRTIALWNQGEIVDNIEYLLANTPCFNLKEGFRSYPTGVQQSFPFDKMLIDLNIDSYMGIPLIDSKGHTLGIFVFMHHSSIENSSLAESLLKIFSSRAQAEMERRQYEQKIIHIAYHDALTNLPNRNLFVDKFTMYIEKAKIERQQVAVLFMDIDGFKLVNDTMGHESGDLLLKSLAKRLTGIIEDTHLVSRFGGDEFTILIPGTNVEDTTKIVRKIINELQKPIPIKESEIQISPSIGISIYPLHGINIDNLIKKADAAMYFAKDQWNEKFKFYTIGDEKPNQNELILKKEMEKALKNEEFILYYQAKVNTITSAITGVETLIRWNHPEKGWISPNDFIPIAERTGLINPIGECVLRAACMQNKTWLDLGYPPVRISVNISTPQLKQRDFIKMIEQVLSETGLHPNYLELEITENMSILDFKYTNITLNKLKNMGIHISIDDFGTGHSSLHYLSKLPVDTVKIDQSFVQNMMNSNSDLKIVEAIISMSNSLNLKVIAEGVETESQIKVLSSLGCYEVQGYWFSKPVPAHDFENLLVNGVRQTSPSSL